MDLKSLYTSQLLWGEAFLQRFTKQLKQLYNDEDFMGFIEDIRSSIPVKEAPENIEIIKEVAKKSMYDTWAASNFSILGDIVYDVAAANCAKNSAYISVYLAMRIFALSEGDPALAKTAAKTPNSVAENGVLAPTKTNATASDKPKSEMDFRLKWPAEYRCEDGHYVRSKNEMLVDNWLYSKGICHAYERGVFSEESRCTYCSDFFIPSKNLFIEIWGMDNSAYAANRKRKTAFYNRLGLKLMEIAGDDIKNLDDKLSKTFGVR